MDDVSPDNATDANPPDNGSDAVSLTDLSDAYAKLMGIDSAKTDAAGAQVPDEATDLADSSLPACDVEDAFVSPDSILEAVLFVGHPENEPLTSAQLAGLMRGVEANEIDDMVKVLCAKYEELGCPYEIISEGAGYRMTLRGTYARLRENFYGKVREVRLSQNAIDVLAIVAYHQPIGRKRIDEIRGKSMGAVLNQLVRRRLLDLRRDEAKAREAVYSTTDRFLDLFGLESVSDLPNSDDA